MHREAQIPSLCPSTKGDAPQGKPSLKDYLHAYDLLVRWCRARQYAGYDPYDGLNSRLFRATPLVRWSITRLVWTQLFKRLPINLRPIALVPAERNAKGMALFALAALARFRTSRKEEDAEEARALLDQMLSMKLTGWRGACWGYNFDWQGRAFFAPRGTPTIVPTAFAARALIEAARDMKDARYGEAARSACEFILADLRRSEEAADEICFSYSPLDRTRVYNASLLAAETLACVGATTKEWHLLDHAARAARYVVRRQRADGSWAYGADPFQSWCDNFHTAFILVSLARIRRSGIGDAAIERALDSGYRFWRDRFFIWTEPRFRAADGQPKYYHDALYPTDAHAVAAAIVAFLEISGEFDAERDWADRVARWALDNLRDRQGCFHYQRRRFYTVRIPYMRWSQAWMLYALARLIESRTEVG
ncbi:hypothetical protein [Pyrinomonas sp.]|uniref:hypothetical protein n=1 Tax=Pyrinomonas sp. TaxID=2080306 RepID=UPI0033311FCE